jgi:hypothetical protein
MSKIKITETQLMLMDLALATAIRWLVGEHQRIKEASKDELILMAADAEARLGIPMDKIRERQKM